MRKVRVYEYAGFQYDVAYDDARGLALAHVISITAKAGQHRAAYKERHRQNARDCFLQDLRAGKFSKAS